MGKSIIWGHGRDGGDDRKIIAMHIAYPVVLYIIFALIVVGAMSDYHSLGWGRPTIYGIRSGDIVLAATNLRAVSAVAFAIGLIVSLILIKPSFDSRIDVRELGIVGVSKSKEIFELKYDQISSVHTQVDSRWKNFTKRTSVIVNASGKTFQVYTMRNDEIAAEINKRRSA